MTSNFYDFASRGFTETNWSNWLGFSKKICIKKCLEVEETHVVWYVHLERIYFYWIVTSDALNFKVNTVVIQYCVYFEI